MAVVLAFRVAIVLTGGAVRVLKASEGPGAQQVTDVPTRLWGRLSDPGESNSDLELALGESTGILWSVTNYAVPFELRKAQVRWGRSSGAAAGTDDAVTTHHYLRISGGAPSDAWVAADFIAAEARFTTFWNAINESWGGAISLKQIRWYKAGPSIAPPQAPVRVVDPAIIGTGGTATTMPPQAAISVTEKTSDPRSWGRFYLPHPISGVLNWANGRLQGTFQTDVADAADAMYEGLIADGIPAVVYSAEKPARTTAAGATLPAIAARALGVTSIQVDDLVDVIRSRRWTEPLLRVQRDIAGS